jgi:hypothetical protein
MKERLLKSGVTLFLVAVMIMAGILASYPLTSQAAGGTTYNVVIQKNSPLVSLVSIGNGAAAPQTGTNEGITFKMVVDAKAKTEKLKTGAATYYPVTIIAKSFKVPTTRFPMICGGMARQSTIMSADAKVKLYTNGGDVDVSQVINEKKLTTQIGDGTVDPAGSMIIPISTVTTVILESTGKPFMVQKMILNFTTGNNTIIAKGSKSGFEGKRLPDADSSGLLPKPLVGAPLKLDNGTGTLVGTTALMNLSVKTLGELDMMIGEVWVMTITK